LSLELNIVKWIEAIIDNPIAMTSNKQAHVHFYGFQIIAFAPVQPRKDKIYKIHEYFCGNYNMLLVNTIKYFD
jgi:hypothetical protein